MGKWFKNLLVYFTTGRWVRTTTGYRVPGTGCRTTTGVPGTGCRVPDDDGYRVPGAGCRTTTGYRVPGAGAGRRPGTGYRVPVPGAGLRRVRPGTRNPEPGTRNPEPGTRSSSRNPAPDLPNHYERPGRYGLRAERRATRTALTIAGSDPSGGPGPRWTSMLRRGRVHGCSVLTAVTVQNTAGVRSATPFRPGLSGTARRRVRRFQHRRREDRDAPQRGHCPVVAEKLEKEGRRSSSIRCFRRRGARRLLAPASPRR